MESMQDLLGNDKKVEIRTTYHIKKAIQSVKNILCKCCERDILLFGIIGSRVKQDYLDWSDIDMIIILNTPMKEDPTNFGRLSRIKNALSKAYISEPKLKVQMVPTFRVEDIIRTRVNNDTAIIHLLLYSSLDNFIKTETPSIVKSICQNIELIIGDKNLLSKINLKIMPNQTFSERIVPLLELLHQTYLFTTLPGCLDTEILKREAISKNRYVLKYILTESLVELGYTYKVATNFHFITKHLSKLPINQKEIFKALNTTVSKPAVKDINTLFSITYSCANKLLLVFGGKKK